MHTVEPLVARFHAVLHAGRQHRRVGLEIADAEALRNYAPLPAARGDFLFRAGRLAEARVQFERAAELTRNEREKAFLLARAAACRP